MKNVEHTHVIVLLGLMMFLNSWNDKYFF